MLFETRRHPDTHNGGFSHGPPRFSPYPRRFVLLVLVFLPVVSPKEVAAAATSCGPSLSPTDFAAVAETANNSIVLCGFFFSIPPSTGATKERFVRLLRALSLIYRTPRGRNNRKGSSNKFDNSIAGLDSGRDDRR